VLIAVAIPMIRVLLELRDGLKSIKESTVNAENSLVPVLQEIQLSLQSLRHVTDNVAGVTDDARVLSGSIRKIGEDVRIVSNAFETVAVSSAISVAGLKVGIKAALVYLLKNSIKNIRTK